MPENYVTSQTDKGSISISEEALAVMVTAAIREIDGVAGFSNAIGTEISELLGIKSTNANRGVKLTTVDGGSVVDVLIMVRYGYGVQVVAKKVQEAVSASLEDMTGMKPVVNVHVTGISFDKADMKG